METSNSLQIVYLKSKNKAVVGVEEVEKNYLLVLVTEIFFLLRFNHLLILHILHG